MEKSAGLPPDSNAEKKSSKSTHPVREAGEGRYLGMYFPLV